MVFKLFAILQKYDFSSKSQLYLGFHHYRAVVCDTAKVRFFKQITTDMLIGMFTGKLFAILQKYDFSSKSQLFFWPFAIFKVVCDTAKVRFFKQITTYSWIWRFRYALFAILQKYDFSSKSQHWCRCCYCRWCCLRYCKSTIFQANHNIYHTTIKLNKLFAILQKYDFSSKSQPNKANYLRLLVVCDTAKVRFFKQITTNFHCIHFVKCCLRYCKSTIFQANHNMSLRGVYEFFVVCDTAKVRFFKQITTDSNDCPQIRRCLRYCKSTIFQANHNGEKPSTIQIVVVCDTAKVRFFKQITT